MKKYLLSMIVLFTMGQMCKAQSNQLLSGNTLKPAKETKQMTVKRSPAKAEGTTQYWISAMAHYNEYNQFDVSQLTPSNMQATVTFNGDEVTIDGMFEFGYLELTSKDEIKGHYDEAAKTITISTPEYDSEKPISDYTSVGTLYYYGSEVKLALFAGNFAEEPNEQGQYGLETVDELVFDVSDDFSTLTPRTGYGSYGFYTYNGSGAGFLNFYKTATFTKRPEGGKLMIAPEDITLEGPAVTVGATVKTTVKLSNIGLTATEFGENIDDPNTEVFYYNNMLEPGATTDCQIIIYPTEVGEYKTSVEFYSDNGTTAKVNITANVAEAPDFSPIVKKGDITFAFNEDMPFKLTSDITGSPVAVSTNENESYGNSSLVANVSVPEGKTGIFSWKGMNEAAHMNGGAYVIVDGVYVVNNVNEHQNEGFLYLPIDNTFVLGSGNHEIVFTNVINMNSYLYGYVDTPFRTYVYDLAFEVQDEAANAAILKTPAIDFGSKYIDKLSAKTEATATLINAGSEPLQVTAISTDGPFSGIVSAETAQYQDELNVTLVFEATEAGEYTGNVVISTNAGDFTVECASKAVKLETDYQPIVTEGDFSFCTDLDHPFIVEGDKAYSSTSYIDFNGKVISWLEAEFVVPEGKQATLSWTGLNSSEDWFNFMGQLSFNDGTRIKIDGETIGEFCGEVDASSSDIEEQASLTLLPGRHTLRFEYEKILTTPKGNDKFTLSNLALQMADYNAIEAVNTDANVVKTEIFSLSGKRLNNIQKGVNIVKETMADGTQKTHKIISK